MKKLFLILAMLTLLLTTKSYAHNHSSLSFIDEALLNIVQEKVYFSADQIVVSETGLYALVYDLNGDIISYAIPNLQYDSSGVFIYVNDFFDRYYYLTCRACLDRICNDCNKCRNLGCISGRICYCGRW